MMLEYSSVFMALQCFQAPSPSDMLALPVRSSPDDCGSNSGDGTIHSSSSGKGNNSRWSTLSWDVPSDLLSPPTPDPSGTFHLDSDSRPSSGRDTHFDSETAKKKPWITGVKLNINLTFLLPLHSCPVWLGVDSSICRVRSFTFQTFVAKLLSTVIVTIACVHTKLKSHIPVPDRPDWPTFYTAISCWYHMKRWTNRNQENTLSFTISQLLVWCQCWHYFVLCCQLNVFFCSTLLVKHDNKIWHFVLGQTHI